MGATEFYLVWAGVDSYVAIIHNWFNDIGIFDTDPPTELQLTTMLEI